MKIISQITAIPGFQTEMVTKRQNLRTAALNTNKVGVYMLLSVFLIKMTQDNSVTSLTKAFTVMKTQICENYCN